MSSSGEHYINYYNILGVTEDASLEEIRKNYATLVKKYHPDKNSDSDEYFKIISKAWATLSNQRKRAEYDEYNNKLKKSHEDIFTEMKHNYFEYIESQNKNNEDKVKLLEDARKKFKEEEEEFEKRINEEFAFNIAEMSPEDLLLLREQEDIENSHNKLFKHKKDFSVKKFNTLFDKYKTKVKKANSDVVVYQGGPNAFNINDLQGNKFNMLDNEEDITLFDKENLEENDINNFLEQLERDTETDLTEDFIESMPEANYNHLEKETEQSIEEKIKRRNEETKEFEKLLSTKHKQITNNVDSRNIKKLFADIDADQELYQFMK
jgi:curved DNA-binding protein CbpA